MSKLHFAWEVAKQLIGFVVMLGSITVIVYTMEFLVKGG